jgi:hypothetical protein
MILSDDLKWTPIDIFLYNIVERIRFAEKQKTSRHSLHNHILPELEGLFLYRPKPGHDNKRNIL